MRRSMDYGLRYFILYEYKRMKYKRVESTDTGKLWAHLHCFDLGEFEYMYADIIDEVSKDFALIVTFSKNDGPLPARKAVYLEVPNKGFDIGGKFSAIDFLINNKINYEWILMLHSKRNEAARKSYFSKIINYLPEFFSKKSSDIGIYSPNTLRRGEAELLSAPPLSWGRNSMHMESMVELMGIPDFNYIFPDGNMYILTRAVAEYMFDDRFNVYERLSTGNSFDYPWFIHYYKLPGLGYDEAFDKFKREKLFGNHVATGLGWAGLADCMLEHAFERLVFGVCKKLDLRVHVLNYKHNKMLNEAITTPRGVVLDRCAIVACHTDSGLKTRALMHNMYYYMRSMDTIYLVNSAEFEGVLETALLARPDRERIIINGELSDRQSELYLDHYPDLTQALKTPEQARQHYTDHGRSESRRVPGLINVFISYTPDSNMRDYAKWDSVLSRPRNYNKTLLANDSFMIVNDTFARFVDYGYNSNVSMLALIDSNENSPHYPDFLRLYDSAGIDALRALYASTVKSTARSVDLTRELELKSSFICASHDSYFSVPGKYCGNIDSDEQINAKYMREFKYPIIKLTRLPCTE